MEFHLDFYRALGFSGGSDSKESACSAGDLGLIPGSERSPGEGNDNPLLYSCLENSMDRGAWWAYLSDFKAYHPEKWNKMFSQENQEGHSILREETKKADA